MKELVISEFVRNPFTMTGDDWLLLTAGNEQHGYNTMTVAWAQFGSLWERDSHQNRLPTAVCYVRPSRYTKEFLDREECFTLSHFPTEFRKALGYLGSHSGRDEDKIKAAGLTPIFANGTTAFAEADEILYCRKLYSAPLLESGFADHGLIDFNYPQRDFHTMYIGEIFKIETQE